MELINKEGINMTTDYVVEVAKKYITPEKCTISILLPNEGK